MDLPNWTPAIVGVAALAIVGLINYLADHDRRRSLARLRQEQRAELERLGAVDTNKEQTNGRDANSNGAGR